MTSIDQARIAIQQGDRKAAGSMLAELVTREPQNAAAWSLLAEVVDDPQQILFCHQRAQSIAKAELSNTTEKIEGVSTDENQRPSSDFKKCPYCAESIRTEAVVCRFCGKDLRSGQLPYTAIPTNQSIKSQSPYLDRQIETLAKKGWRIVNRTPTTAQLRKQKQWSTWALILFVVLPLVGGFFLYPALYIFALIGLILVVFDYLVRKDGSVYYTEEQLRQAAIAYKQQRERKEKHKFRK